MGRRDARDLATTPFAGVQGAALLASTLRDRNILSREVRRLERCAPAPATGRSFMPAR
jgi:hypothetical protein